MQKGFFHPNHDNVDSQNVSRFLAESVARGLISTGQAHRIALLAELRRSGGEALSGRVAGDSLHLSRAAVHKQVEQLRSLGFTIEPVGGAGYRLAGPTDDLVAAEAVLPLLLELVRPDARTSWVAGLPYRYLARCPSTNQVLRAAMSESLAPGRSRAAARAAPAGALVITDEQTGGRGRLGRGWLSLPGKDLTFSVLLRPNLPPARAHLLSLAAALAVAETLEAVPGLDAQPGSERRVGIKWPNDVLLGGRKVSGILVEGSMDSDRLHWAIAGIGLNVNGDPAALTRDLDPAAHREWKGRPEPTSLGRALGGEVPRAPLLAQLLARLTDRWNAADSDAVLEGLRQRDLLQGRAVEVVSGPPANEPIVHGEALGIGEEGQLLVRAQDGRQVQVFAGDVSVRSLP